MEAHPEVITTARKYLVRAFPFYATLILRLPLVADETKKTMATDGRAIYYNPAWTMALPALKVAGVLAHEALHVALLHHTRRGDRDPRGWNHAADYADNAILLESGLFELPDGALYRKDLSGLSAERIYDIIKKERQEEQQKPKQGPGEGSPGDPGDGSPGDTGSGQGGDIWAGLPEKAGEVIDMPGEDGEPATAAEVAAEERAVGAAVFQAAQAEKSCGSVPGAFESVLEAHQEKPQDWLALIRHALQETVRSSSTWSIRSRRSHALGVYLPGRSRQPMGKIALAVDTSGSVSNDELNRFGGEVQAIAEEVGLSGAVVIYCDARINRVDEYDEGEELQLEKPGGRGGTRFDPPFRWLEDEGFEPHAMIYFTDGVATVTVDEPSYPVIWATTTRAPSFKGEAWGEVVEVAL